MKKNNYEAEIDLKELLFRILFGWRKIIVLAIFFTILCGGYKFITTIRAVNNKVLIESQNAAYQTALSNYTASKTAIENDIAVIKASMERQQEYNDKSILMKINPYDEKISSINYYIDTNYQIMPGLTYQNADITTRVIRSYVVSAQNGELLKYIMNNLSYTIEAQYLKELIYIEPDYVNHMLYVQVMHSDIKSCEEILMLIMQFFEQKKEDIDKTVGEHTISLANQSSQSIIDLNRDISQKSNIQTVENYRISITDKQNAIDALIVPVKPQTTITSVLRSSVKYAIVGFILGAFLEMCYIMASFLMSDRLLNANEIRSRFNLRLLGIVEKQTEKHLFDVVDILLNRLKGVSNIKIEEKEAIKRICANILTILKTENIQEYNIMFTGTIDIKKIETLYKKISIELTNFTNKLIYADNISYTAKTIEQITDYNVIIIVEEIGCSTNIEITKELDCLNDLGKKVIGAVLI